MLARSKVTPERNALLLISGISLVRLLEIFMQLGGSEAPDRSNHLVSLEVGLHLDDWSILPTSDRCFIADPAR